MRATWTPLGHLGGALGQGNTTNDKARCVKAMHVSKTLIWCVVIICVEECVHQWFGVVEGWVWEMLIFHLFYNLC